MSKIQPCPECGTTPPADAPRGLCPRCLMGAALESTAARSPRGGGAPAAGTRVGLDEFRDAILELRLVDSIELGRAAAGANGDALSLARSLVQARRITPYQAGALLQGKARGLLIGRHLVLDKLGTGGMGVVFKARQLDGDRIVALKMLPPSFGRDPDAVQRFRREFEVAARLSHPNIVRAIEAAEDRGVQFLTMEYIRGHNLEQLVGDGGSLSIKLALHCAIQAARGLEAAHAQRIIHRDVKPANLMLDEAGGIRVLDLGLARVIEATNDLGRSMRDSLTRTGAYMGTVDFLAPEQADDAKRADHRSDIYGLGCALYFLLAGRPPFPGDTLLKKLMAHQDRPAPSLKAVRPEVSEDLETIHQNMMAKRPIDRPQSMTEVIERLEACRSTDREAGDASADLKTFARTVMKRAQPKGKIRDTSVFARTHAPGDLRLGDDLNLEDVILDFRDEKAPGELPEEKLPPRTAAPPIPRRRSRRRTPWRAVGLAAGALSLIAGYFLWPRTSTSDPSSPSTLVPGRIGPQPPKLAAATRPTSTPAPVPPTDGFAPLFAGNDLSGWRVIGGELEDWELKDGVLASRPHEGAAYFLVTRKAYRDFQLELEFQPNGKANGGFMLMTDGARPDDPNTVEVLDIGAKRTQNSWIWGDGGPMRFVEVPSVTYEKEGGWEKLTVERRDDLITLRVNGRTIHDRFDRARGPRWIGFQNYPGEGFVRYRNARIKDLSASGPTAAKRDLLAHRLYFDDFGDPNSGLGSDVIDMGRGNRPMRRGYEQGAYFIEAPERWAGASAWDCTAHLNEEFQVEAIGRVLGVGASPGGWGLLVCAPDGRGFQVAIDRAAQVVITPAFWGVEKYPNDPSFPVIAHPAVMAGNEWNTLALRVRKHRLEILVNGQAVRQPIAFDWDLTPAQPQIVLFKPDYDTRIRVEFDRVEIRALGSE